MQQMPWGLGFWGFGILELMLHQSATMYSGIKNCNDWSIHWTTCKER